MQYQEALSRLRQLWVQRDASIPISHCHHRLCCLYFNIWRDLLFHQHCTVWDWVTQMSQYVAFTMFHFMWLFGLSFQKVYIPVTPFNLVLSKLLLLLVHPNHREHEGLLVCFHFHLNVNITFCIRTHWYIDVYVNVLMFHIECLPITVLCCVYTEAF